MTGQLFLWSCNIQYGKLLVSEILSHDIIIMTASHYVADTMPVLFLNPIITLYDLCGYLHFKDIATETQQGDSACPRSHSQSRMGSRSVCSKASVCSTILPLGVWRWI